MPVMRAGADDAFDATLGQDTRRKYHAMVDADACAKNDDPAREVEVRAPPVFAARGYDAGTPRRHAPWAASPNSQTVSTRSQQSPPGQMGQRKSRSRNADMKDATRRFCRQIEFYASRHIGMCLRHELLKAC